MNKDKVYTALAEEKGEPFAEKLFGYMYQTYKLQPTDAYRSYSEAFRRLSDDNDSREFSDETLYKRFVEDVTRETEKREEARKRAIWAAIL